MSLTAWWARRLTRRARHNDYDYYCRYWWGDRNPEREDHANRDFGGAPTRVDARRCLICRPHSPAEADALIEWDPTADLHLSVSAPILNAVPRRTSP